MDLMIIQYWPQLLVYTGFIIWLIRLEGRVSSNQALTDRFDKTTCNLTDAIGELRETVAELKGIIKTRGK